MIQRAHRAAKCSASTTFLKFWRRRCLGSFRRARTSCAHRTLDGGDRHHDGPGRSQGVDEPVTGTEGRVMNLLRLISGRTASAPVARERLQILLAHERGLRGQPDLLGLLRTEILAAVSRHIVLDPEKVIVRMDRGKHVSTLEVDIEVPNGVETSLADLAS